MADYYVWSGATGTGDGSSWANAYTTLTGALAGITGAGTHSVFVDSALAETPAAAATISAATAGQIINVQSVNRGGRTTGTGNDGLQSGAKVTTPNTFALNIGSARNQTLTISGMTFETATGAGAANSVNVCPTSNVDVVLELTNCTLSARGTNGGTGVYFGFSSNANYKPGVIRLVNCTINGANKTTGSIMYLQTADVMASGLTLGYSGASKPASAMEGATLTRGSYTFGDSDLSGFNTTSGNYVVATNVQHAITFRNCKLSATPGLVTGTFPNSLGMVQWVNSDSADTRIFYRLDNLLGTATYDTTYYRANGAKMYASGIGLKLVTTASCNESNPFRVPFFFRGLSASGSSTTFAVECLRASAAPTNREMWLDLSYISDAGFPLGTVGSSRNATPYSGTGASLTSSSETWAGSLSGGVASKAVVTVTPQERSLIRGTVSYGKASDTIYLDPCVTISGQTDGPSIAWSQFGVFASEPAASAAGGTSIFSSGIIQGVA